MRTETVENYLKTIYNLSSDNTQVVSNQKLADKLSISPASVTEALRKLHELKHQHLNGQKLLCDDLIIRHLKQKDDCLLIDEHQNQNLL